MTRVWNWRAIIQKAWSFRLAITAGVLSAITAIMIVRLTPESSGLYMAALICVSVLSSVAGFSAGGARIVYQKKLHDDT